jgi:RimJ/RimL family protein N-acetyltransferase
MSRWPPERIDLVRIVLRRERVGDEDLVAEAVSASLDHLRPWMPWAVPAAATAASQRDRLVQGEQGWDAGSDYTFALLDDSEQELFGIFGLHRRVGPSAIELGYWLTPEAVGRGYATDAARALTQVALALPDVATVEIHCDEANGRSRRIPQRLGYRLDRVEQDEIEAPAEVGRSMIWVYPP